MRKFTVYSLQFTVFLLLTLYPIPHTLYPTHAQETPLPKPSAPLPEEQAIYNLNRGLLPAEVQGKESDQPKDQNFSDKLLGAIKDLFKAFGGFFNPSKFFAQSKSIHQAEIPREVTTKSNNPIDKLKNFLGGSSGIYGVNLPKEIQSQDLKQSEKAFEKVNFPEGIHPITGP